MQIEAKSLNHARYLHDMLLPVVPLLIALSAASPIYKGQLSDIDHGQEAFMTQTDSMNEEEEKRQRFTVGSGYVSNH